MATLMLSVGVPMMLGGDELGHSQNGNNNAYCQDNELTWLDWELDDRQKRFLDFARKLIFIRRSQPVLHRRKFFLGRAIRGSDIKDISFFNPSGQEMSDEDWNAGFVKCLGVRLAGDLINDENERGEPIVGETLLILLNGHWEPIPFTLPADQRGPHLGPHPGHGRPERGAAGLRGRPGVSAPGPLVRRPGRPRAADKGHTATPTQVRAVMAEAASDQRPVASDDRTRRYFAGHSTVL